MIARLFGIPTIVVYLLTAVLGLGAFFGIKAVYDGKVGKAAVDKAVEKTNEASKRLLSDAEIAALDFVNCDGDGVRWSYIADRCEPTSPGD